MIPIGTLCIAKKLNLQLTCWWDTTVAGKTVTVVSHDVPLIFRFLHDQCNEVEFEGRREIAAPDCALIPISNPGLTDEIIKETLAPHLRPMYDILVNMK